MLILMRLSRPKCWSHLSNESAAGYPCLFVVDSRSTAIVTALVAHHRDPFDRILIAQAQTEEITLLTQDALITQYPISTIW